jgi:hypothetical protein
MHRARDKSRIHHLKLPLFLPRAAAAAHAAAVVTAQKRKLQGKNHNFWAWVETFWSVSP